MWRFKQFMPKEQSGLEGRTVDVGNMKVHVRNAIAEGGFSCVYLAFDAMHPSRQYALKHIICNDEESLDLAKKEISVMKLLKGHPNVVTLNASSIFDMGRTKEVLLLMDFCEKSLVAVLENRGAGYFEEKQVLLIFRDVCNAVFAMHCQSPPVAHRDLKAENVLLGADGAWKLCDFGSTSTNHKCFDRPEEMGIEEDIIRKHTTPAYRAPEMWDLFRKEVISEKVDIWALGCLLYRICFFKSAFDGESKLQILNGNYRIPEVPKYSSSVTELIKDMLQASPDARPDITQVWFRVNLQLPEDLQKQMPDGSVPTGTPEMLLGTSNVHKEGIPKRPVPQRSPPPPPSSSSRDQIRNVSPQSEAQHSRPSLSSSDCNGGPLGAFWSTQHAQGSQIPEDKGPSFDEEPRSKHNRQSLEGRTSPPGDRCARPGQPIRRSHGNIKKLDDVPGEDFEIRFDKDGGCEEIKASHPDDRSAFANEAFNTFVAEFDTSKLNLGNSNTYSRTRREELEAQMESLKEQLKQSNLEKAEMTSKYEKLSAICRSQRQEIQELKNALATATPSHSSKDVSRDQSSPGSRQSSTPQREKMEGSVWELQQGMLNNTSASPSPDSKPWQAFTEEPKPQPAGRGSHPRSVRTINGHLKSKQSNANPATDAWGFEQDSFVAFPANPQISRNTDQGNTSQRLGSSEVKMETNQPAGWAGF
uniref:non-specific serine/threonine protein kinase n=2 Tax=Anthurium amnicola TaxID=1678845 RepID=A0A1D1XVU3_9ARAE